MDEDFEDVAEGEAGTDLDKGGKPPATGWWADHKVDVLQGLSDVLESMGQYARVVQSDLAMGAARDEAMLNREVLAGEQEALARSAQEAQAVAAVRAGDRRASMRAAFVRGGVEGSSASARAALRAQEMVDADDASAMRAQVAARSQGLAAKRSQLDLSESAAVGMAKIQKLQAWVGVGTSLMQGYLNIAHGDEMRAMRKAMGKG